MFFAPKRALMSRRLCFNCLKNESLHLILTVQKCTKVVDIAMVVDESWSIGRTDFEKIKKFLGDIISRFCSVAPFGTHFAVVKYSTSPREVFSLTKYTDAAELHYAVRNMDFQGGSTYTGKALELVQKNVTKFLRV